MEQQIGWLEINNHRTDEKHPNFRGRIDLDGRTYYLSSWIKTKDNKTYLSLSLTQDKSNVASGGLFINERKASDSSPDFTGNISFKEGEVVVARYYIGALTMKDEEGNEYLSLYARENLMPKPTTRIKDYSALLKRATQVFADDLPWE